MKENKKNIIISGLVIASLILIIIILSIINNWPANVSITSDPSGAEIYINNKKYETSEIIRLRPGEYVVWAAKEGYLIYEKKHKINRDDNIINIKLEPDPEANFPPEGAPIY